MSSAMTLLTAAWLSPVPRARSWRVSGPSRNSFDSSTDRLRRRTLRFVARSSLHPPTHPYPGTVTVRLTLTRGSTL